MLEKNRQRGARGFTDRLGEIAAETFSRTAATTALATVWDFFYAIYLNVAGHATDSLRMRMTSAYYFSLVGVSVCVLVGFFVSSHADTNSRAHKRELVASLVGSFFLLDVNAVVALVIKHADDGWMVPDYTDTSFYLLTFYSLVMLILTIHGWRCYRHDASPAVALAKGLSLCKAVMTFYFLALAAAQRYAVGGHFLHLALTGAERSAGLAAAGLSFGISVITFARSIRELWQQRGGRADHPDEES